MNIKQSIEGVKIVIPEKNVTIELGKLHYDIQGLNLPEILTIMKEIPSLLREVKAVVGEARPKGADTDGDIDADYDIDIDDDEDEEIGVQTNAVTIIPPAQPVVQSLTADEIAVLNDYRSRQELMAAKRFTPQTSVTTVSEIIEDDAQKRDDKQEEREEAKRHHQYVRNDKRNKHNRGGGAKVNGSHRQRQDDAKSTVLRPSDEFEM